MTFKNTDLIHVEYTPFETPCKRSLEALDLANFSFQNQNTPIDEKISSVASAAIPDEEPESGFARICKDYYHVHLQSWETNCSYELELLSSLKEQAHPGLKMCILFFLDTFSKEAFASPYLKVKAILKRIDAILYLLDNTEQTSIVKEITAAMDSICIKIYTKTNIPFVQKDLFHHYKNEMFIDESELPSLFSRIESNSITEQVYHLALHWINFQLTSQIYESFRMENLPNNVFSLSLEGKSKTLDFFRMASPESKTKSGVLSKRYTSMLRGYALIGKCHMDVSLLSLSEHQDERKVSLLRLNAQNEFPHSLFAWASDAYSPLATQRGAFAKDVTVKQFLNRLFNHLLRPELHSFIIPEERRKDESFRADLENLIKHLYVDAFGEQLLGSNEISCEEKMDFYILITAVLTEYFAERLHVDSINTTCRQHIDRGMLLSTVLYQYALIKSGEFDDDAFLESIQGMVFAPSLMFENRPTHLERMQSLLSVINRLSDKDVQRKLRRRKTYFSNCKVTHA